MSLEEAQRELEQVDGVLVPGGFGSRGWEGKILACRVAREHAIPYLGICLGMHVAVSEFARHVLGLEGANSTEMDPETPYPVIDLLPEQKEVEDLGGTMRLGAQAVELVEGTRTHATYDEPVIHERHRHRYEVNNHYRQQIVDAGLAVSGTFQEGRLVEIVELPDHPWFVASQFHPEFKSRPTRPAPLFREFVGAAHDRARSRGKASPPPPADRTHPPVAALDLFLELAALPSPPGEERAVADRVAAELRELGLTVDEDDAGTRIGSSAGNLYARLEPTAEGTPLFLCSHMDTVPPVGAIEPVVDDGVVRNAGGTILGADNKSAVVAMVESARRVVGEGRPHAGLELVFTMKEEVGLQGAEAFDASRLAARVGYVYDQAGPIGEVILGAPNSVTMGITFRGQAAHAGMAPEEGRSAIAAASRAIADMRLGRLDDETTANVGTITGGVARNIVPDRCTFSAEARSHDEAKLADVAQEMLDACSFAASLTGCEVETEVARAFHGYRFRRDDEPVRLAAAALERTGHTPTYALSGGGADANVFNMRGLQCVNLANGMAEIHTPGGAHRRRRPRGDGRGHARSGRGGAWRLAFAAAPSPRCSSGTRASPGSRSTASRASPTRG